MLRIFCIASLALAAVSAVSGHIIRHRRGQPKGWQTEILQSYPEYHSRYLAWDCENKHNTKFFDTCCHPLLSHESIDVLTNLGCEDECDDGESSDLPSSVPSSTPQPTHTTPSPDIAPAPSSSPSPTTTSAKFGKIAKPAAPPASPTSTPVTTSTRVATPSPSPASSNNNGNGGNGGGDANTGGQATFFLQNGVAGACGQVHSDSDFICAMDQDRYGDAGNASPLCGKQVVITNTENGKQVTVTVADDCPTCKNSNSIDLSKAAFDAIAPESEGVVPISWVFK